MCTSCTRAVQSSGTLTWMSASRPGRAAVAAGQRDRPQPAGARRLERARRRSARRRSSRSRTRRRRPPRAPRSAARTRARTRSRWRRSSACSCRSSAPAPRTRRARAGTGRPARPRSAARRRRCRRCRTPAPSGPPRAPSRDASTAAVATAVRSRPRTRRCSVDRRVERARVTVATAAPTSIGGISPCGVRSRIPAPTRRARLDVGDELLLRHLQRLVRLHRQLDLHRVVLPQRIPFPVVRHQDAAQVGMAVEVEPEEVEQLRARPSSPPARRSRPSARASPSGTRTFSRSRFGVSP